MALIGRAADCATSGGGGQVSSLARQSGAAVNWGAAAARHMAGASWRPRQGFANTRTQPSGGGVSQSNVASRRQQVRQGRCRRRKDLHDLSVGQLDWPTRIELRSRRNWRRAAQPSDKSISAPPNAQRRSNRLQTIRGKSVAAQTCAAPRNDRPPNSSERSVRAVAFRQGRRVAQLGAA